MTTRIRLIALLTLMATGRAMTLAFLTRAGDGGVGDPPAEWLMPLLGDAIIGLAAPIVAYQLWRNPSLRSWVIAIVWSTVAIFDAAAAFLVETATPWPDFFMLQLFGRWMFLAAISLHLAILFLLLSTEARVHFGIQTKQIDRPTASIV